MLDDNDLKKLQKSLKDELRPIKELVEVLQSKVGKIDLHQTATSMTVRSMKDQQSVINEKLDDVKKNIEDVKSSLDANTASVMEIESTLKGYGDMYKINQDHIVRLDKRTSKVEKHLGIEPPDDQKIPHFS